MAFHSFLPSFVYHPFLVLFSAELAKSHLPFNIYSALPFFAALSGLCLVTRQSLLFVMWKNELTVMFVLLWRELLACPDSDHKYQPLVDQLSLVATSPLSKREHC